MTKSRACELCCATATLFCPSDNAFLCHKCDSKVHDANFLVARHIRQPICDDDDEDSASSACISSTTKEKKYSPSTSATSQRKLLGTYEAEGIFMNWCGKLGVSNNEEVVIRAACGGLRVCLDKWKFLPYRIGLAASMWLGLRVGGGVAKLELSVLKRLEEISGVPPKVILAAESKLGRAIRATRVERRRRSSTSRVELQEGWAEC